MAIDADLNGVIANVGNGVGHWKRMATRLARTLAEPQARSGTGRTKRRAAATSGPKYRHDRTVTNRLGLQWNEPKTKTGNAWEGSFDFLGFEIRRNRSYRSGKSYPHVQPGKKAVKRIKAKLTELTGKNRTPLPLPVIVQQVNQVLRGWGGYFHYRNCTKVLGSVRWHTDERLRTHLRKRYKVKQRYKGYKRFPSEILYQRYGLFKLPATAPWKRAHAHSCNVPFLQS